MKLRICKIRRGQCLSPLTAPALRAMMTYYLFGRYHSWGEPKRLGWNRCERSRFFKHCNFAELFISLITIICWILITKHCEKDLVILPKKFYPDRLHDFLWQIFQFFIHPNSDIGDSYYPPKNDVSYSARFKFLTNTSLKSKIRFI